MAPIHDSHVPLSSNYTATHSRLTVWSRSDLDLIRSAYRPLYEKDGKVLIAHTRVILQSNEELAKRMIAAYPSLDDDLRVGKLTLTARAQFKK